jgi:FkbM family methyltransferase
VIDVGANVGHYTLRLAELVGPEGRVIAIEPIPRTFALLAANCAHLPNVSLLNVAILEGTAPRAWMRVPQQNYYRAHVAEAGDVPVLGLTLDTLPWRDHHISLIKIDAEGCDAAVLNGAMQIIHEQRPTLIVESLTCRVEGSLKELGYCPRRLERSPNRIFLHDNGAVGV